MQPQNPYAAPASPFAARVPQPQPTQGGIWRDGSVLVMHRAAVLPDICVKSNQKTDGYRLKRNLSWHNPLVYIALMSPLIYIILAAVLSKKATVYIALNERWRRRRVTLLAVGWSLLLLAVVSFFGGMALADGGPGQNGIGPLFIIGSFFVFIAGLITLAIAARVVWPAMIDDQYVRLNGCHNDFLANFPQLQPLTPHMNPPQQIYPQ